MIWKHALKYPVLIVGIVLFAIFLGNPNTKDYWQKVQRRFKSSTCDVTVDRVKPKAPDHWKFSCETVQLLIIDIDHEKVVNNRMTLRQEMYRELANSLVKLGHYSNLETMSFLKVIRLNLHHPELTIESVTDGKAIVEILSKKDPKAMARMINLTVKTKEITK